VSPSRSARTSSRWWRMGLRSKSGGPCYNF
jgi:hypothetical protein